MSRRQLFQIALTERQLARFWSKVYKAPDEEAKNPDLGGCWTWHGSRSRSGHGQVRIDGVHQMAHRVAYVLARGPFPKRDYVLHRCDMANCVRADGHLYLGDHDRNMRDASERGRIKHGSWSGAAHPLAKLTDSAVLSIRLARFTGLTHAQLADRFGVSRSLVQRVQAGKCWTHLGPVPTGEEAVALEEDEIIAAEPWRSARTRACEACGGAGCSFCAVAATL